MTLAPLPVEAYRDLVARALAEDIGGADITSELTISPDQFARGILLAKSRVIVAGLAVAVETVSYTHLTLPTNREV